MIVNNKPIEKQIIFNKVDTINIKNEGEKAEIKLVLDVTNQEYQEEIFKDPTQPYSSPSNIFEADFHGLEENYKTLENERLLLVSSFENQLLNSATNSLIKKINLDGDYTCRVLEFQDSNLTRKELSIITTNREHSLISMPTYPIPRTFFTTPL